MSEQGFTPGKWQVYGHIGEEGLRRVRSATGKDRTRRTTYTTIPASNADARLIAAAPELLEELEWFVDRSKLHMETGLVDFELSNRVSKAQELIKRVRGEN